MQQLSCLLLCRLNRHKPHGRAHNRLADCFRIGGIVLVALDVRMRTFIRGRTTDCRRRPVTREKSQLRLNMIRRH